ncbi:MAG: glycosyltransferase [Pirellulales bacterium]|nr:glycosyltransferase [Pirellulales bacterium]
MKSHAELPRKPRDETLVSLVLPVYNEQNVLGGLLDSLIRAVTPCGMRYEILFVNDGSRDDSPRILDCLAAENPHVRVLHLSRNFGHQAAVQAGLAHAQGDAIILMDADLQDAPEAIVRFVDAWLAGYDVVYAIRTDRKESLPKRVLFTAFYRLLAAISTTRMPLDAGNFGLIDRRVAREIVGLSERDRYYAGLRAWVGFRQKGIEVERGARYDDQPRVSFWGLVRLAKTAIFSFSAAPLALFQIIGLVATVIFLVSGIVGAGQWGLADGAAPWVLPILGASFFAALNALGIAMLGEYVLRIYDQVRGRPIYLVDRTVNFTTREEELAVESRFLEAAAVIAAAERDTLVWDEPYASEADFEDDVQHRELLVQAVNLLATLDRQQTTSHAGLQPVDEIPLAR